MAAGAGATEDRRRRFEEFIERHVAPHECIRAVVVYGSVALGVARPDSDVDAYVFMDPLDTSIVPAEAIWNPAHDSFRSIFAGEMQADEVQIDLARVALPVWRQPTFVWPLQARAALTHRWIAFERPDADIEALIADRTTMTPTERRQLVDRALLAADGLGDDLDRAWELDEVEALDALNALWEALIAATYAVNGVWLPYRGRALRGLRALRWRGGLTDDHLAECVAPTGRGREPFLARARLLTRVHGQLLDHLTDEPDFGPDPTFSAFLRAHDEPGRAWNMDEWNDRRASALRDRGSG